MLCPVCRAWITRRIEIDAIEGLFKNIDRRDALLYRSSAGDEVVEGSDCPSRLADVEGDPAHTDFTCVHATANNYPDNLSITQLCDRAEKHHVCTYGIAARASSSMQRVIHARYSATRSLKYRCFILFYDIYFCIRKNVEWMPNAREEITQQTTVIRRRWWYGTG